jgi:hypothetical protein
MEFEFIFNFNDFEKKNRTLNNSTNDTEQITLEEF